ncbi:ANTAR domain-containing protein [Pseudonocardia saturnea]
MPAGAVDRGGLGIVMAQRRCTPTEAFAMLRTISQKRNAKLRVVATEMVEAVSRPARRSAPRPRR